MEEPQSLKAPSIAAEVELSANAGGLTKVLGEAASSLLILSGPILEIANGGSIASAAWRGFSDIIKYQVIGSISITRDVVHALGVAFRDTLADAENLAKGVEKVARIQVLEGQFTPLLKSAEAAKQKIAELQKLADKSPFQLEQVAEGARSLQLLTKGAYAGADAVRTLMDVSALTGAPIGELGATIGQLHDGLASGREIGIYTRRLQELGAISGTTRNQLDALSASGADNQTMLSQGFSAVQRDFKKADGQSDILAKTLRGAQSTRADKLSAMQQAYSEPFAAVETDKAARESKEYEAKRPMMQRRGEIDSTLPRVTESIKGAISGATIQTDVGKAAMSTLASAWRFTELAVEAALIGRVAYLLYKFKNYAGGLKSASSGASWGAALSDFASGAQTGVGTAASRVSLGLTKVTSGISNFRDAESVLGSKSPALQARRVELLDKLGFANTPQGNNQAMAHMSALASQERVNSVSAGMKNSLHASLGVPLGQSLTAERIKAAPFDAQNKAFQTFGLPVMAGSSRPDAHYEEMANGVKKVNAAAQVGASGATLFGKAWSGVMGGIRAIGGMIAGILGPILILTALGAVVEVVWGRYRKLNEARADATKSAASTTELITKLEDEAAAAQTAEERANSYRKSLEALADAKAKVRDVKLHKDDMTGAEYGERIRSAYANLDKHEDSVENQRDAKTRPGAMNLEQQKDFIAAQKREQELKNSHELNYINSLTGDDAVSEAKRFADQKTVRREELELRKKSKNNFYNSKNYVEADKDESNSREEVNNNAEKLSALEKRELIVAPKSTVNPMGSSFGGYAEMAGPQMVIGDTKPQPEKPLSDSEKKKLAELRAQKEEYNTNAAQKWQMMQHSGVPSVVLAGQMNENSFEISEAQGGLAKERKNENRPEVVDKYKAKLAELNDFQIKLEHANVSMKAADDVDTARTTEMEFRSVETQTAGRVAKDSFSKFQQGNQEAEKAKLESAERNYREDLQSQGQTPVQISEKVAGPEFVAVQAGIQKEFAEKESAEIAKHQIGLGQVMEARGAMMGTDDRQEFYRSAVKKLTTEQEGEFMQVMKGAQKKANVEGLDKNPGGTFGVEKNEASRLFEKWQAQHEGAGTLPEMNLAQTAIKNRVTGLDIKTEEGMRVGAERVLSQRTSGREAQHAEFMASLKGYGTSREMAAAAETSKFTASEAKQSENLLVKADRPQSEIRSEIAQKEDALKTATAQKDPKGVEANTEALRLLRAALGVNVQALRQDVLQKQAAANEAARREETLKRESNFSRSQAYLNSASTGYRFMEKNATGDSQRLEYRKKADALEDKAIFERTQKDEMESLPKMREIRGKPVNYDPRLKENRYAEEGKIDPRFTKENLAKTKATLEVEKNKSEREIERSQRPVIASDLARVGGGKYETAGGSDVAKAQLDRLGDINAQLDQLNQLVKVLQTGVDSTNQ